MSLQYQQYKSKTRYLPAEGDVGAHVPEETNIINSSTHQKVSIWQKKKAKLRKWNLYFRIPTSVDGIFITMQNVIIMQSYLLR